MNCPECKKELPDIWFSEPGEYHCPKCNVKIIYNGFSFNKNSVTTKLATKPTGIIKRILIILCVFLISGLFLYAYKSLTREKDYCPLEEGREWLYNVNGTKYYSGIGAETNGKLLVKVMPKTKINDLEVIPLQSNRELQIRAIGQMIGSENIEIIDYLKKDYDGVYLYAKKHSKRKNLFVPDKPYLMVPKKIVVGNTWNYNDFFVKESIYDNYPKFNKEIASIDDVVYVTAGRFDRCIKIKSTITFRGYENVSTFWYAPDVGFVKGELLTPFGEHGLREELKFELLSYRR